MQNQKLPIARYRFYWQPKTQLRLPEYAGSALRGIFGHALLKTACMTKLENCETCPLKQTCPYTQIFATPAPENHQLQQFNNVPNPYIIEAPSDGKRDYQDNEIFIFDMVLVGNAISQLPLITFAWQRAFSHGIGKDKHQAELLDISFVNQHHQEELIYSPELDITEIQPHQAWLQLDEPETTNKVTLYLETPLRLQNNGKAVTGRQLTAQKFLNALVRRSSLLLEFHHNQYQPPSPETFANLSQQAKAIEINVENLGWKDWERYSNRQQQLMTLGGLVGKLELTGKLTPFMPYLQIGQWTHLGKNAVFGLGKYTLE